MIYELLPDDFSIWRILQSCNEDILYCIIMIREKYFDDQFRMHNLLLVDQS